MATSTSSAPRPSHARQFAARVVDRVLARSHSLLTSRRSLWTTAACAQVTHALETAAGEGEGQFPHRWETLLRQLDDANRLLAAEALAIHLWYPNDVSPQTKFTYLTDTAALMDHPFRVSPQARAGLAPGVSGSGVSYGIRRLSQLAYLTRAIGALTKAPRSRRQTLTDPWCWKEHLWSVPVTGGAAQREVLLHLVHPQVFEPIVSPRIKRQIVHAHADHLPAELVDIDEQLGFLRRSLLADDPGRPLRDLLPIE